ncbi:30S ribosomal protein S2, partial [bacterium]|nr:30S ribosomal protein S2 [bacterium]
RWNPKMKKYIFGARNGIYIIDLQKTVKLYRKAYKVIVDTVADGGEILFVGTKRQAQESIKEAAVKSGMHWVNSRWLGGMMTNFDTIKKSINRLHKLETMKADGTYELLPKKEVLKLEKKREKLEKNLGGVKTMKKAPACIFVIDTKRESIAVAEANKLGIPVVAIVDSNCDPDVVDYVVPGNDDAIRAIKLFCNSISEACVEGRALRAERLQTKDEGDVEVVVDDGKMPIVERVGEEEKVEEAKA